MKIITLKKIFCLIFLIVGTILFILGAMFSQTDLIFGGNIALIGTFIFMLGLGILTFNSKPQMNTVVTPSQTIA